MNVTQLLKDVNVLEDHIDQDVEITSLSCDSRTMEAGALFVALPGYRWDGNDYVAEAVQKGAKAIVCQRPPVIPVPYILGEDAREALAVLAAN